MKAEHLFYKTGDACLPPQITDRNGDVVLRMCRVCGAAEAELPSKCPGRPLTPKEIGGVLEGTLDFNGKVWTYPQHLIDEACCEKEDRGWGGGCRTCGDPCL